MDKYLNYKLIDGPLKVLDINVMFGANYFSGGPVVVIRIDLCEYDEVFTNEIPNFYEKLKNKLPSLEEHFCSIGKRGGFFQRVQTGTLLGHVIEHTAIELQTLAGMDVGYGKTRSTLQPGVYNIVFRFFDEIAGVYAGKAAVNLINSLLLDKDFDVDEIVKDLIDIRELRLLGPSTQAIVNEAKARKIPYLRLDAYNLIQLGTGKYQKRTRATITCETSLIGVETADDKYLTNLMLKDAGVPVAETYLVENLEEILEIKNKINAPLVIKPREGHLGQGISVNLKTDEEIKSAFNWAKEYDSKLLVQPYIPGNTYRILVINYKFVAACKLTTPFIIGDGKKTIKMLIDELNSDPNRTYGDKSKLSIVEVDEITEKIFRDKGYDLNTILAENEILELKTSSNLKLGGISEDVTDIVHDINKFFAERASKVIGLNVAGIDIKTNDISQPINLNNGVVLEVNAAPDFRMHLNPMIGTPRNVAKSLVDMLFPEGQKTRVPIFSVTGTIGKTITVNLISYILKLYGFQNIGICSTEGLFISDKCLMKGDMTYSEHVALVLKDPTIDCAVLETSREGILRRGLGYEFADVGIVLNVYNDHVGSDDIKYLEDLAYAKSVVAEQVYDEGYSVLNADIDLVIEMESRVYSNLVFFTVNYDNRIVREHIDKGGIAVILDGYEIIIYTNRNSKRFMNLDDIPLLAKGLAKFNQENVLAVIAALYAYGIPLEIIKKGLKSFYPNKDMIPGRLNIFEKNDKKVILDYAHNIISFEKMKEYLRDFSEIKIGIFDAPGDRTDEDLIELGKIAAKTYNYIYLYEGFDQRGRTTGEIMELIKKGLKQENFPDDNLLIFDNPISAWEKGIQEAGKDKIVVILSGRSEKTLEILEKYF